jgi:hypothetical protein
MKLIAIERRLARAVLEGFAPTTSTEGLVPLEGEVDYVTAFENIANASTDRARIGVRFALWLVALAPIWLGVALCTMAGLSIEKRAELLDRMLVSRAFIVRELALLIKLNAAFAMLSTRSVRARSNYDRKAGRSVVVEPILAKSPLGDKRTRALPVLVNRPSNGVA